MAPLFPRSGPGESGSPMSQVLLGCYDFPLRIPGHLFASLPRSTRSSLLRVSQFALPVGGGTFQARVFVRPATRTAGSLARGRERDLPGFQAIHPVPLPRSTTPAEPTTPRLLTVSSMLPPHFPRRRLHDEFRGSITRLWHLLPTLQERCCHHPCKTHFRLAGSPLPGGRRPSGSLQKVSGHPSSFSGLGLAQGKFHF